MASDRQIKRHGTIQAETPRITRWMLYIYFVISFYEPFLNGTVGSVTKYYIFAFMGVALYSAKKITLKGYQAYYIAWLVYQLVTLFWTRNFSIPKMHFMSQFGMVALLLTLTAIHIDGKTIDGIIKTLWLGSASIGVLSLFFSAPYSEEFTERMVLTLFGYQTDPNNQAAFVAIGIAISIYYFVIEKKYKIVSLIVIGVNVYSIFQTGSRGGLVSIVAIAICFGVLKTEKANIKQNFKKLVLIILIAIIAYWLATTFLPADIYHRLFDFETYEGGNERTTLWKNAWSLYTQGVYPIFGAGWGAYFGYNGYFDAVHNTFLAMLCDVGLMGFIIFFKPIVSTTIEHIKRKDIIPICLLVTGLAPSFFLDAINKRFFWNAIIILFLTHNYWKEKSSERGTKYD